MIVSMTGFGKARGQYKEKKFTVEIKSLNSKQADFIVRVPSVYKEKELEIRSVLSQQLQRGKVELNLSVEDHSEQGNYTFNRGLAAAYFNELKVLANEFEQDKVDYVGAVLSLPDVMKQERAELNEGEWNAVKEVIQNAIEAVQEFRSQEGDKLAADFTQRIASILALLQEIEKHDPSRVAAVRDRISRHLEELLHDHQIDKNRHEQELIYYLEKLDITEEKVRLKAHCDYFSETMALPESHGKKLSFIGQEIGREINTIGSKANDATMQRAVVQMKDELEKIKEQVLNVL